MRSSSRCEWIKLKQDVTQCTVPVFHRYQEDLYDTTIRWTRTLWSDFCKIRYGRRLFTGKFKADRAKGGAWRWLGNLNSIRSLGDKVSTPNISPTPYLIWYHITPPPETRSHTAQVSSQIGTKEKVKQSRLYLLSQPVKRWQPCNAHCPILRSDFHIIRSVNNRNNLICAGEIPYVVYADVSSMEGYVSWAATWVL